MSIDGYAVIAQYRDEFMNVTCNPILILNFC